MQYLRITFSKRHFLIAVFCLLSSVSLLVAHETGGHDHLADPRIIVQEINPWTQLDFNNDPDHFQFAIVTDRTGGYRPGVFEDAVIKLNLLQPEFVVSVGDLIEGYTEDLDQLQLEWNEFQDFVSHLEMPFFYTPGNHDISNPVMAEEWEKRLGRSYYHFVYRDVLFLCLNTEDGEPSHIGEEQIEYVSSVLAENADVRWTLVFQHKPLWNYDRDTGWSRIEELLTGHPHTVFAGHFHTYTKHVRNDQNYFVLATTGGGSSLRGPLFGEFDHVVWVTMMEEGPRIANLMLEGIRDENIRTEDMAVLIDPLNRGSFLGLKPIYSRTTHFSTGTTTMRLDNTSNIPLRITGQYATESLLSVSPAGLEIVIQPETEKTIEFTVAASDELPVEGIAPIQFSWTAEYEQSELDLPVIEGSSLLAVVKEYSLAASGNSIVIDGSLDDWDELPFVIQKPATIEVAPEAWSGPDDCSWRFGLLLGEEYLYIGVEVTDDSPVYRGGMAWEQDGIEVRLDARPDPERAQHRGRGENYYHLLFALGPDPQQENMTIWDPETLIEIGTESICRVTPDGHNTEIAIPLSYLIEQQGNDWRQVRLNIAVDDFDAEDGPLTQLWWQPDWRDEENLPGSGTFGRK